MSYSKMYETLSLGSDFWNDSCDPFELEEAVNEGAVGATSNPVIVAQAIENHPEIWNQEIDNIINNNSHFSEDEIAWKLIETLGIQAANILLPVHKKTLGKKGQLSLQVNPKYYNNTQKMIEQAKQLFSLAPNIAIKIPATASGLKAIETLTAQGISINVTVSFTLSQAIESAKSIERGLSLAKQNNINLSSHASYITLMVGRLDDHLKRIMDKEKITIDPGYLNWAGIAVFKKAYRIFLDRNYTSKLLVAAFRNHLHWSELIGENVVISMPYNWWKQFNHSNVILQRAINNNVSSEIVQKLLEQFSDFKKAYNENELSVKDFQSFGATTHTLNQFLEGYDKLIQMIRKRMLMK